MNFLHLKILDTMAWQAVNDNAVRRTMSRSMAVRMARSTVSRATTGGEKNRRRVAGGDDGLGGEESVLRIRAAALEGGGIRIIVRG